MLSAAPRTGATDGRRASTRGSGGQHRGARRTEREQRSRCAQGKRDPSRSIPVQATS